MRRFLLFIVILFGLAGPAGADDIANAGLGVARVFAAVQMPDGESGVSMGTGFAVTPRHVVTNYHVVRIHHQYASQAEDSALGIVPSQGSRPLRARITWTDEQHDLALLEIVDGSMTPLRLFTGAPPASAPVTVMGYPANVDNVTIGSIREYVTPMLYVRSSGDLGGTRSVGAMEVYIHTANIGRGNSGGPLVDRCGRVLGVNSAAARVGEGDGAFAFAVSNNDLATFLRTTGVAFQSESGACVTTEERAQQEQTRIQLAAAQARDACAEQNRTAREHYDRLVRDEEAQAKRASDQKLFMALGLLVCAGLAAGGGGLFASHKRKRAAIIAGSIGGLLLIGSIVLFVLRDAGREPPQAGVAENCEAVANSAISNMTSATNGM